MTIRERGRESLCFVIRFNFEDVGALDCTIPSEAEDAVRSRGPGCGSSMLVGDPVTLAPSVTRTA